MDRVFTEVRVEMTIELACDAWQLELRIELIFLPNLRSESEAGRKSISGKVSASHLF